MLKNSWALTTALVSLTTLTLLTDVQGKAKENATRETPTEESVSVKTFTPAQVEVIKSMIGKFIKENPQVIADSMQAYAVAQKAEEEKKTQEAVVNNLKLLQHEPTSPVLGNPKGDVTLVEFFDYNCVYCRKFHPTLKKIIAKDTDLRVVLKPFPILSKESILVSQLAMASMAQGKFEAYHSALMEYKDKLDEASALEIAKTVGLDVTKLKAAMNTPAVMGAIQKNATLGDALHLQQVPIIILGDKKLDDLPPAEKLEFMINELRHKQAPESEEKAGEPKKEEAKKE